MAERMPVLFVGHGSPMNAIEDNEFTRGWERIAISLPRPEAILCVSAHWFVPRTSVTANPQPRTIHDFYGFPQKLYQQQYPAPGDLELVEKISKTLGNYSVGLDTEWGLDHGTWSVLRKMYPEADIPTIQLSINYFKPPRYHFELGHRLEFLRDHGILIIGSGNLVHNLGAVNWNSQEFAYDWAQQFEEKITDSILNNKESTFVDFVNLQNLGKKAHPTLDHYLPLLYSIGAGGLVNEPEVFNKKFVYGSISMTSFKFS